jgi:ATP-dependent HslUV protease ATP-binding subunit HslU
MHDTDQPSPRQGTRFEDLTPREIVARLDEYIIGQDSAKRAVAVAIRNRLRRLRVQGELRDEIMPKNLILIGPTGVGKTEIARRMAALIAAPFIKVEATKFTEVGYVGRDVDSIVRELAEVAVRMVRQERLEAVEGTLLGRAIDRLVNYMQPLPSRPSRRRTAEEDEEDAARARQDEERFEQVKRVREKLRAQLRTDALDGNPVTIETSEGGKKLMQVFTSQGLEEMGMDLANIFDSMTDKQPRKKRTTVADAKRLLLAEEAERAIDMDAVMREAIERVEQAGIVFIDEIDKIAHRESQGGHGPDVSREGVQRDILPLVEGTTILTKYGPVRSHHVLFIAAGAFHTGRVSDLIPEFQGRFPLRVELTSLGEADFVRILREPRNSLIRQYTALLATEGVELDFTEDGIAALARFASEANSLSENIGARRLHTVLEKVLEDVSFAAPYSDGSGGVPAADSGSAVPDGTPGGDSRSGAPDGAPAADSSGGQAQAGASEPGQPAAQAQPPPRRLVIDAAYVSARVADLVKDKDLAGYIL